MATPSSILAWRIPWTEETGRLQSKVWQRIKDTCSDLAQITYVTSINLSFLMSKMWVINPTQRIITELTD